MLTQINLIEILKNARIKLVDLKMLCSGIHAGINESGCMQNGRISRAFCEKGVKNTVKIC